MKTGNCKGQSDCHSPGGRTPTHAAASLTLSKPVLQFRCIAWHKHYPSSRPAPCQTELWKRSLSKAAAPFLLLPERETFLFCSVDRCAEKKHRYLITYILLLSGVSLKRCWWVADELYCWSQAKCQSILAMAVHSSQLCTLPNLDTSLFGFVVWLWFFFFSQMLAGTSGFKASSPFTGFGCSYSSFPVTSSLPGSDAALMSGLAPRRLLCPWKKPKAHKPVRNRIVWTWSKLQAMLNS